MGATIIITRVLTSVVDIVSLPFINIAPPDSRWEGSFLREQENNNSFQKITLYKWFFARKNKQKYPVEVEIKCWVSKLTKTYIENILKSLNLIGDHLPHKYLENLIFMTYLIFSNRQHRYKMVVISHNYH